MGREQHLEPIEVNELLVSAADRAHRSKRRAVVPLQRSVRILTEALEGLVSAYDVRRSERGTVSHNASPSGIGKPWGAALDALSKDK